jgi:hypothetical protein
MTIVRFLAPTWLKPLSSLSSLAASTTSTSLRMSAAVRNPVEKVLDIGRGTFEELERKSWLHLDSVHSRTSTVHSRITTSGNGPIIMTSGNSVVGVGAGSTGSNSHTTTSTISVNDAGENNHNNSLSNVGFINNDSTVPHELLGSFHDSGGEFNDSCASFASFGGGGIGSSTGGSDSDLNVNCDDVLMNHKFTQLDEDEERSVRAEDMDGPMVSLSILGLGNSKEFKKNNNDEDEDYDDDDDDDDDLNGVQSSLRLPSSLLPSLRHSFGIATTATPCIADSTQKGSLSRTSSRNSLRGTLETLKEEE